MPEQHPNWFDWITVAAIIAGPVLALFAQRWVDLWREKDARRKRLFFTLMSTRGSFLSAEHVQALNTIDEVFHDDDHIRGLWHKCVEHLDTERKNVDEWNEKAITLRIDLYQAIGNRLGFTYTHNDFKRHVYVPQFHVDVAENQSRALEGLANALSDGRLKVELTDPYAQKAQGKGA